MLPAALTSPPAGAPLALGLALAGLVGLAALNPGGATGDLHRAGVVVACGLVALAHAWTSWRRPRAGGGALGQAPALAAALVVAAAALQVVPAPPGLVAALAPATADLHAAEAAALGGAPMARPLSIEPGATGRAAALGLAYLAVFLAARGVGRDGRGGARTALALALVTGGVALAALAVQADSPAWRGRTAWPFVNPNHLATFLVVGLGLALGVGVAPLPEASRRAGSLRAWATSRRGLAAIAAALMLVGVVATRSRAGALAAAVVAVVTPALAGRLAGGRLAGLALVVAVVTGAALATTADVGRLAERFDDARARPDDLGGRVENWSVAWRVVAGRPWAGAGLGTFDDASLAVVDPGRGTTRPGDAHNDYLELAGAVGAPAAALAIGLLLAGVVAAAARARGLEPRERALVAGALGGTLGALAHAGFDFALKIPSVALLTTTALGLAWGAAWRDAGPERPPADGPARAGRLALAAALLVVGLPLLVQAAREDDARRLAARAFDRALHRELRAELARRARGALERAEGPLASAALARDRALVEEVAGDAGWLDAAVTHARRAAARAPGRAGVQAQLGLLLLQRPEGEREGAARLDLALRLGPTVPAILLVRGEWALVLLGRTGDPAHGRAAAALLGEALRRDPALRPAARAMLDERTALLGAQGLALREELGL